MFLVDGVEVEVTEDKFVVTGFAVVEVVLLDFFVLVIKAVVGADVLIFEVEIVRAEVVIFVDVFGVVIVVVLVFLFEVLVDVGVGVVDDFIETGDEVIVVELTVSRGSTYEDILEYIQRSHGYVKTLG